MTFQTVSASLVERQICEAYFMGLFLVTVLLGLCLIAVGKSSSKASSLEGNVVGEFQICDLGFYGWYMILCENFNIICSL